MIRVPTAPWAHTVFDILAWTTAAALGAIVRKWRLSGTIARVASQVGPGYAGAILAGALPGAWLAGSFNTLHEAAATLSHSIAGALAGAIVAVEIYKLRFGIRISTGAMFVAPFAAGVAIGRWGCLFAGLPDDTYGTPTTLPWGVDLGDGIARHPVQIYESLSMAGFLAVFLLALGFRRPWAATTGFYVMAGWYGAQRFGWEFLKPYPAVFGPLNVFQLICLGLMIYAVTFSFRDRRPAAP
jgi:hypothetical protein